MLNSQRLLLRLLHDICSVLLRLLLHLLLLVLGAFITTRNLFLELLGWHWLLSNRLDLLLRRMLLLHCLLARQAVSVHMILFVLCHIKQVAAQSVHLLLI